ncbi:MAG: His/Gly/Thr/Pro-type tRNA ligase C-terminal domain-containing protein [Firmicutes bacterium]|nr:His/Gly/Thr/Pro-type tRNA ligase C-terminal domain-containing protein [Bacillota bacterium]
MKLSNMGLKTRKTIGKEEVYASEFLLQSGQLKRFSAGCYGFGTLLVKTKRKLEDIIRKHLDNAGCAEVQYSILQARKFWEDSGRWQKYTDSGTMFVSKGRHSDYSICATAEEMSCEFLKGHIQSYRDLGFCHYQIGTKFRDELRAQGGLLKSKEFNMMDAYSFDESREKMTESYDRIKVAYFEIFKELGFDSIKAIKSINDMGGRIASEFMFFDEEYGQDTIYCNDELGLYVNGEVFELEEEGLKELILREHKDIDKSKFVKRKATEAGHIFQNDQVYSKMMGGTFINREGKQDYYWNGCYGFGVSRMLCLLVVNSLRKYGKLIWEDNVAAFKLNIIAKSDTLDAATQIYNELVAQGLEVCLDDRDLTIGEKIKDNELYGIRRMLIVGKSFLETGKLEYEDRLTGEKKQLSKEKVLSILREIIR